MSKTWAIIVLMWLNFLSATRRSVSQELVGFVSPYTDSKTTLNLTYYF